MGQVASASQHGQRFRGAMSAAWESALASRHYVLGVLYAVLVGGALESFLRTRPPVAEVPSEAWAVALAAVAFLLPRAGIWLFIAVFAVATALYSPALALLVVAGALAMALVAQERSRHGVPVRFALLVAALWGALHGLACCPWRYPWPCLPWMPGSTG